MRKALLLVAGILALGVLGSPAKGWAAAPSTASAQTKGSANGVKDDVIDHTFFQSAGTLEGLYRGVQGVGNFLLGTLGVIEVIGIAFGVVIGIKQPGKAMMGKLIAYSVCFFVVTNYQPVMKWVRYFGAQTGLLAGGSGQQLSVTSGIAGPGTMYKLSQQWIDPYVTYIQNDTTEDKASIKGTNGQYTNMSIPHWMGAIIGCVAVVFIVIPFLLMTLQYFVIYLKFSVLIGFGVVFVPLALHERTKFMSEHFFGSVLAHMGEILLWNYFIAVGVVMLTMMVGKPTIDESNVLLLAPASVVLGFFYYFMSQSVPQVAQVLFGGRIALEGEE